MNTISANSISGSLLRSSTSSDNSSATTFGYSEEKKPAQPEQITLSVEGFARLKHEQAAVESTAASEDDNTDQAALLARLSSLEQQLAKSPSLDNVLFSDPATAADAVSFTGFYRYANAGVSADDMATKLHLALSAPGGSGTNLTDSMDLAMTQAKLNKIVADDVEPAYQQQAAQVVQQFVQMKASQQDDSVKVLAQDEVTLASSLNDADRQAAAQSQLAALNSGSDTTQITRNQFLQVTASGGNSDTWFSTFAQSITGNGAMAFEEHSHLDSLRAQWQGFISA